MSVSKVLFGYQKILNRSRLPDSAIDVLDEASAKHRMKELTTARSGFLRSSRQLQI